MRRPDSLTSLVLVAGCATLLVTGVGFAAHKPGRSSEAIRLASATYGVPEAEMRSVAWCESRMNPNAVNKQSGAAGLMRLVAMP